MFDIKQLCAKHPIILQETCLVKQSLHKLMDINDGHFARRTAEVHYEHAGITTGRPYMLGQVFYEVKR